MDAAQALSELRATSPQIRAAVVLGADGSVQASTLAGAEASQALAAPALELVAAAFELSPQPQEVVRVEVELRDGGLFVLHDAGRTIAATTEPDPTAGLVVYDLRTCLHSISAPEPKKRFKAARQPEDES